MKVSRIMYSGILVCGISAIYLFVKINSGSPGSPGIPKSSEVTAVKEKQSFMSAQAAPAHSSNSQSPTPALGVLESPESAKDGTDVSIEDRLSHELELDPNLSKIAEISNVECKDSECSIAVQAKDPENSTVQMTVLKFVQAHPEFGTNFTINESKEDPRVILFTFAKDKK